MLRNFDDLDLMPAVPSAQQRHEVNATVGVTLTVVQTSTMAPVPGSLDSGSKAHLYASEWGWEELRDYVVSEIISRFGAFPRNPLKESGIFKGFMTRWGTQAEPIARAAFDVHGGYWRSAPITVTRFAANCDPYFAAVIAASL